MIFQSFLSVASPLVIGFLLVCVLWPGARPVRSDFLFKLCISVGPGFGLFSCLYFLQLSLFGPSRKKFAAEVLAVTAALLAALLYRVLRSKGQAAGGSPAASTPKGRLYKAIPVVFFVALASALATFIFYSLKRPHGEWDAWAVYNMKARFLFRAGEHWRDVFTEPLSWAALDYPILWPGAIAGCWTLIGTDTVIVPVVVAMLFTFATVGVVASSVARLRGQTQGLLAGLVLLCTPYFIMHGADQYSDIPVGFFYLTTLALVTTRDQLWEKDNKLLLLAGLIAGLTAWTKNEGLLFVALVIAARLAVTFHKQGIKARVRQTVPFAAGVIPILMVVFYFKYTIVAHNGYLAPLEESTLFSKITDFSRYRLIADHLIGIGLSFGRWTVSVIPLLAFYLLLLGVKTGAKQKKNAVASLVILGLMMAGFLVMYLITSRDLTWLIVTSLERLISQLWPGLVFVFFLIVKTPEEALVAEDAMSAPA
ncbi:MAG TPA: glycosyltransferase family 39 protein [Blastocatellia bacterium]|nr:glycosyltransferase family 39 protein [Blastocatellia bacterium]